MPIAFEPDATDLDLGPFTDDESHAHRCRWNRPNFGADGSELVSVFRQQRFDHNFGMLDLRRIVLRFGRKGDFVLFEPVENVTLRDGVDSQVADVFNSGPFFDIHVQDPAFGSRLPFEADIFEVICVPERVEIAFNGALIENIAWPRENVGTNRFRRNSSIAMDIDSGDYVWLLLCNHARLE